VKPRHLLTDLDVKPRSGRTCVGTATCSICGYVRVYFNAQQAKWRCAFHAPVALHRIAQATVDPIAMTATCEICGPNAPVILGSTKTPHGRLTYYTCKTSRIVATSARLKHNWSSLFHRIDSDVSRPPWNWPREDNDPLRGALVRVGVHGLPLGWCISLDLEDVSVVVSPTPYIGPMTRKTRQYVRAGKRWSTKLPEGATDQDVAAAARRALDRAGLHHVTVGVASRAAPASPTQAEGDAP
jgi:hypothetical protein